VKIPTRRLSRSALATTLAAISKMAVSNVPQRRTQSWPRETTSHIATIRLYKRLASHISMEHLIIILAVFVSVVAYVWYAQNDVTTGYGDAVSRMMIARRVVASRTPGLAQLGSTWLPLHTMLMLPLIWNDTLFHSGLAGSLPSMMAYVVASLYLFKMARFIFTSYIAAWVGALAFMLNPSVIYMQATAMSEVPLLCAGVIAIYYMLRWARSYHAPDLVKSAAAVAVGTGIRYDGWALAVMLAVFVVYFAWRREGYQGAEGWGILYGSLAFSSCVAWVIYNAVIFHDPLLFVFFGNTQHDTTYMAHFASYHQPWLSFALYGYSVGAMVGWAATALAVVGLCCFIARYRLQTTKLPSYALLIPLAYHWLIFFVGMNTIYLPELGYRIYWNARFGLELIPAVAFFMGYLATIRRTFFILAVGVTVTFAVANSIPGTPLSRLDSTLGTPFALREAASPESATVVPRMRAAAQWFLTQYKGGNVLIGYTPDAPMMYFMMRGIPDRAFITDSSGWQFTAALAHPQDSVSWIVLEVDQKPDNRIWSALSGRQDWRRYFALRKVIAPAQYFWRTEFYERIGNGSTGVPQQANTTQMSGSPQMTLRLPLDRNVPAP
jgi:Dolichyl-phosphate-mannose-protein mannosyltransferase